jgi:P-type E1-E2 ATPase
MADAEAGAQVKMITGDHPATAVAIATQLGIVPAAVLKEDIVSLTGPQLDQMSDAQLDAVVMRCNIFARTSPENKIKIVKSLQRVGQTCSMTGDGVNDAPALKAANIGVAMGITGAALVLL